MSRPPEGLPAVPPTRSERCSPGALAAGLGVLLAIKLAWLLGDPTLRLFLGDSASYLHSAVTGWMPPDRSFTYGHLVRASAVAFASPLALVLLQTAFGIASCALLAGLLVRGFGVRAGLAMGAALLLAFDPGQLFYERMLMAESAGTLALTAHVVLLSAYAHTGRWRWMACAAVAGIAAVSLRLNLLPVVLGLAVTVPVVAALRTARGRLLPAVASQLGVALALTGVLHLAYMQSYRQAPGDEAGYLPASGMMRIGLVAPMIRPEHFEGTGVSGDVLATLRLDLSDPRQRERHVWSAEGLYAALALRTDDPERVARVITSRALRDDPLRLVGMGLGNLADYLDDRQRAFRIHDDLGRRVPDADVMLSLRTHLDYDYDGVTEADSWSTRWFRAGVPWTIACVFALAPLALLALAVNWRTPARPVAWVLCLASLGLVASHVLFAHVPSLRYLHPMPWFVLANLAVLAGAGLHRRAAQGPRTAR